MHQPPQMLTTRTLAKSQIFAIEAVNLQFSNGEKRTYERFKSQGAKGAVMIVPITAAGSLLLVREYAVGLERYEINFPKGAIDDGEHAKQAAQRELQEEVGVGAKQLTFLKTIAISPSYMVNQLHLFLAQDLYPSRLVGDEPEPLQVVEQPLNNIPQLLARPDFTGALSIGALLLAKNHLDMPHD